MVVAVERKPDEPDVNEFLLARRFFSTATPGGSTKIPW